MNSPSGCITALFAVVLLIILAMSCVGGIYLFQADAVSEAITNVSGAISVGLGQAGQAVLYIGIGVMGLAFLVGLGLAIERAGPGVEAAGKGIGLAAIGTAIAEAIEEGKADCLPPVWKIFERPGLPSPMRQYKEAEYKLLENTGGWDGTIQVPTLRAHVDGAGRETDST